MVHHTVPAANLAPVSLSYNVTNIYMELQQ